MALAGVLNLAEMTWFDFLTIETAPIVRIFAKISSSIPSASINYSKVMANINQTDRPSISVKRKYE